MAVKGLGTFYFLIMYCMCGCLCDRIYNIQCCLRVYALYIDEYQYKLINV